MFIPQFFLPYVWQQLTIIFNSNLELVRDSQKEYDLVYPNDGWVELDPGDVVETVKETISNVLEKNEEIDPLTNSFAEIVKATGIKTVIDKMVKDPAQKHAVGVFLDALIEKQSPHFESMRESLKDDSIRRKILLEML